MDFGQSLDAILGMSIIAVNYPQLIFSCEIEDHYDDGFFFVRYRIRAIYRQWSLGSGLWFCYYASPMDDLEAQVLSLGLKGKARRYVSLDLLPTIRE